MKKLPNKLALPAPGQLVKVRIGVGADLRYAGRQGLVVQVFDQESVYVWFELPSDGNFFRAEALEIVGTSDLEVTEDDGHISLKRVPCAPPMLHWGVDFLDLAVPSQKPAQPARRSS